MHVILLSGGSGKRLWPLSNDVRSKQFLKVFPGADGSRESMAQRMYRMLREVDPEADITIATSETQVASIRRQLGDGVDVSVEPCRRDTFPAIVLACAYLREKGVTEQEAVVVCPVDPYVERDYFECLKRLSEEAESGRSRLTLMGIEPTEPSSKYGYILPEDRGEISGVLEFREKPDRQTAEEYIRRGALWNGGIFAFRLGYLLELAEEIIGWRDYEMLLHNYEDLKKISFDYAVAEREQSIRVLRFSGLWKDLGTWNALTEVLAEPTAGNALTAHCTDTHVINELSVPMIVLGMKNAVIAATPDGILVSDKETASELKDYVSDESPAAEKPGFGSRRLLYIRKKENGQQLRVRELTVEAGQEIGAEICQAGNITWTVTEGTGELLLGEEIREVKPGDTAVIPAGLQYGVMARTELRLIEVELGRPGL